MARIQHKSTETSVLMLRQSFQHQANSRKIFCRDITFRVHNKEQQHLGRDKDCFCRDKQNMREVNSMSGHEVEKQHKKNDDKEVHVER